MKKQKLILKLKDAASINEWKQGLWKWLYLAIISPKADEKDRENIFHYYEMINEILESIIYDSQVIKKQKKTIK